MKLTPKYIYKLLTLYYNQLYNNNTKVFLLIKFKRKTITESIFKNYLKPAHK